jgi:hypothetical protein
MNRPFSRNHPLDARTVNHGQADVVNRPVGSDAERFGVAPAGVRGCYWLRP